MTGQAHHRLARAAGYADGVLDAAGQAPLYSRTPCRGWDLGMLLEHVGESLAALHEGVSAQLVGLDAPGPVLDAADRSAAALAGVVRQRTAALLRLAARADGAAPVSVGAHPMPLDCLLTVGALEITVHAWDVSQACGQRRPVPDEMAADLLAQACLLVPWLDRGPLFAAPVPVRAPATPGGQLIAYLGRVPLLTASLLAR
jgi:uncharacterized protein (TIGR03086 family)